VKRLLPSLLIGVALLGESSATRAEPNVWQRARDPNAVARSLARLRAEKLFHDALEASGDPELARELSLGSAALLELSGPDSHDARQKVLLGRALLEVQPARALEAVQLLEAGLRRLPASDFKLESWFDLGIGAMRLGDVARAERAFAAALSLAWDPDDRARCYRNRGRVRSLAGRMTAAVSDYRAAVALARDSLGSALSHIGLGVALERSGDYPQGMQEIARAVALRVPAPQNRTLFVLDVPGLGWVPEHDEYYFRALAAMSEAQQAHDPEHAEAAYQAALDNWEQYLPAAEAHKDRFVPNAKRHERRCASELERLRGAGSKGRASGRER
jgi:tetratricopeptide (TPR) repeat protein